MISLVDCQLWRPPAEEHSRWKIIVFHHAIIAEIVCYSYSLESRYFLDM